MIRSYCQVRKIFESLLVFTQQVSLYCLHQSEKFLFVVDISCGINTVFRFSGAPGFPVPFEFLDNTQANSPHMSATAPLILS